MINMHRILAVIGMFTLALPLWLGAQPQMRPEDHFWSKRLVNRISLVEKINQPLVHHESAYYSGNGRYSQTEGMVASLIDGVQKGKYQAYHPEDWDRRMNYDDIRQRMEEFDQAMMGDYGDWGEEEEEAYPDPYFDEFSGQEETAQEEDWGDNTWDFQERDDWGSPVEELPEIEGPDPGMDLAAYEEVIHVVEDWVFDKVRSQLVQKIDFFEVIWVDPSGVLPEKVLARFKWDDVKPQLEETLWKSRFNDAESRSIAEVFELRIFHAYPINVGGEGIRTLEEAETRKQELIEFEHHLWSY
ncbi:MAG: hypothetical protein D6722_27120 [Bacteroidetes bacterium]|nr:MAG: hypothetical protein D6722_27120 [Bacteroidota bacterium]